jgi:hypothetical protein
LFLLCRSPATAHQHSPVPRPPPTPNIRQHAANAFNIFFA